MEKSTLNDKCFVYLWTCVLAYMIEYPLLGGSIITSMIWIPALVLLAVVCLAVRKWNAKEIVAILMVFVFILFHIINSESFFSTEHWIACFCFIVQLLSVMLCSKSTIDKRTFDYIFYIDTLLALLFSVYSLTSLAYKVTYHGNVMNTSYFTFNLDNSNMAGIYLFCIFSILLINVRIRKHKLLLVLLMSYVFYMIWRTNARSCILAALAVVTIFLFVSKKIPEWIVILCMAVPIISGFVYMYLFLNLKGDFVFLGKDFFSGREVVFEYYLSMINTMGDYLFGNFGKAVLHNAHNAPLSIFTSVGIIGLILTYYVYWKSIKRVNSQSFSITTVCVACILGIFFQSSAESTMFLGGFPGVVFVDSFFLLANYRNYRPNRFDNMKD